MYDCITMLRKLSMSDGRFKRWAAIEASVRLKSVRPCRARFRAFSNSPW